MSEKRGTLIQHKTLPPLTEALSTLTFLSWTVRFHLLYFGSRERVRPQISQAKKKKKLTNLQGLNKMVKIKFLLLSAILFSHCIQATTGNEGLIWT